MDDDLQIGLLGLLIDQPFQWAVGGDVVARHNDLGGEDKGTQSVIEMTKLLPRRFVVAQSSFFHLGLASVRKQPGDRFREQFFITRIEAKMVTRDCAVVVDKPGDRIRGHGVLLGD